MKLERRQNSTKTENRTPKKGKRGCRTSLFFILLFSAFLLFFAAGCQADRISSNTSGEQEIQESDLFEVHFLDVDQGDATLILCDDHAMLVDGGKSRQSSMIYSYLRDHDVNHLDYIVATHPDEDHVGGLAGALNYASADVAFSPVEWDDSESFQDFLKYLEKQNVSVTVPDVGDSFSLGSAGVTVLGPVRHSDEDNNMSIVLRIMHGQNSILLTGDAETDEEQDILESGANLSATILKAGHHGSSSSTGSAWLNAVDPSVAVISCGANNSYGHPTEEVLERLKSRGIRVYRTDLQGNIIFREENGELHCDVERNPDADVFVPGYAAQADSGNEFVVIESAESDSDEAVRLEGTSYIGNKNTKKFHTPNCNSVKQMKESNKYYFTGDRQELIDQGYSPCGNCHP